MGSASITSRVSVDGSSPLELGVGASRVWKDGGGRRTKRRRKGGNGAQADRDRVRAGKTAIRTLLGPAYQKLKKVPPVKDEDEAKALMVKILPLYVVSSPSLAPPTTRLLTH